MSKFQAMIIFVIATEKSQSRAKERSYEGNAAK